MKYKTRKFNWRGNMTPSKWVFFALTGGIVLALYLIFCVYPIIQSVYTSFFEWNGYVQVKPEHVGWENYSTVVKDPEFWLALKNDLVITAIKLVIISVLTVLFAVTLTRFRMKTAEVLFYKFVFYIPNVLSVVIIGALWGFVFMPGQTGLLNAVGSLFNKNFSISWLMKYPFQSVGFVASWCGVGLFMLTMIAAIQQIPDELYESARIDGAGEMKQLQYITMPAVWLQLTFMVVSIFYQSLGGNFGLVNVILPSAALDENGMVMGLYVYRYGTSLYKVGFSYAASIVMLIVTSIISLTVKFLMDKAGEKL